MDVETSFKKKQMFILKISWRLVCGPKFWMKGKVRFECSSSSSRRMVTYSLSIQGKMQWKQGGGCSYSMKNITTKHTIKCLFLNHCERIWPACHHLKTTDHSAALKPQRQLHISTRLVEEEKSIILEKLIAFLTVCQWVNTLKREDITHICWFLFDFINSCVGIQ